MKASVCSSEEIRKVMCGNCAPTACNLPPMCARELWQPCTQPPVQQGCPETYNRNNNPRPYFILHPNKNKTIQAFRTNWILIKNIIRSPYQPYKIRVGRQFVGKLRRYNVFVFYSSRRSSVRQKQPNKLQTSS